MQLRELTMLTLLIISPAAAGADSSDRTSPYDTNASCMDRTTDASTGNCVIQDEGTPRHTYPPKTSPTAATPTSARTGASPTVRKAATGSK